MTTPTKLKAAQTSDCSTYLRDCKKKTALTCRCMFVKPQHREAAVFSTEKAATFEENTV